MSVDKETVKQRVASALSASSKFVNLHGITDKNVGSFLIEPYEVTVDPDDQESGPRSMWVVLHERANLNSEGYVVVFDPQDESWGVAARTPGNSWILIVGADSFDAALDGM